MLLDTSGIFSLLDQGEPTHERAVAAYIAFVGRRLTHDWVLAELSPLATRRGLPQGPVLAYLNRVVSDPDVEVVWVDRALYSRAVALLLARPDKSYSLCDAVSFVLMRDRGLTDALTTDKHFEQEGFRRLLG
jgi:predicted nucleic acid-binding protein